MVYQEKWVSGLESNEWEAVLARLTSCPDLWPTNPWSPGQIFGFGGHVKQAIGQIAKVQIKLSKHAHKRTFNDQRRERLNHNQSRSMISMQMFE